MRTFLSTVLVIIYGSLLAQTYSDRFEGAKYEDHLVQDFKLKGPVKNVSTKKFSLSEGDEWEVDSYETERILIFNKEGFLQFMHLLNAQGDTTESKYFIYDNNQLIKVNEVHRTQRGEFSTINTFEYNDKSKLSKIERFSKAPYKRIFTYDEKGRLATDKLLYNGKEKFMDEYSYQGETDKIDTQKSTEPGAYDFSAINTYLYTTNGQLKSIIHTLNNSVYSFRNYEQRFNQNGEIVEAIGGDSLWVEKHYDHTLNSYNEYGDLVHSKLYVRTPGEGDAKGTVTTTYSYDNHNNWIECDETSKYVYSMEVAEQQTTANKIKRTITYFD